VRNDFSPAAFYSIAWMFIGSFFALNHFVGVIVDNFNRIKKESDASATMTPEQQQWVQTMRTAAQQKPARGVRQPEWWPRLKLYELVSSTAWDGLITAVILANIVLMACTFWRIEERTALHLAYNRAMLAFGYIYYTEALLKIAAFGPSGYFGDGWCRFDFFLVVVSLADELVDDGVFPLPPFLLRVLRVIRILRILRLLKGLKGLRDLIVTMILSFPSLLNVGSLLALIVFVYAILGMHLFSFLATGENIDDVRNFHDLSSASLLLLQVLTGDAWSGLMSDAMLGEDSGLCSDEAGDCGSWIAIPYFISFMFVGTFVFLNLVVAVILENFTALGNTNPDLVSSSDIETFKEVWATFDPDGDNFIPSKDLVSLVVCLPPPMGIKGARRAQADGVKMVLKLGIKQHEGHVAFHDVITALVKHSYATSSYVDQADINAVEAHVDKPPPPPLPETKSKTAALPELAVKPQMRRGMNGALRAKVQAEEFALDLPSARQVFAVQLIGARADAWARSRRDRMARERDYLATQSKGASAAAHSSTRTGGSGSRGGSGSSSSPGRGSKAHAHTPPAPRLRRHEA